MNPNVQKRKHLLNIWVLRFQHPCCSRYFSGRIIAGRYSNAPPPPMLIMFKSHHKYYIFYPTAAKVVQKMWMFSQKSSIKVQAAYEKEAGLPGCFSWVVLLYQPSDTTVFPCWYCSITCMAQAAVLASADYQAV